MARELGEHARTILAPSCFAASCSGAPLSIIRQHIKQQRPA
jgi:hypothetical protein